MQALPATADYAATVLQLLFKVLEMSRGNPGFVATIHLALKARLNVMYTAAAAANSAGIPAATALKQCLLWKP